MFTVTFNYVHIACYSDTHINPVYISHLASRGLCVLRGRLLLIQYIAFAVGAYRLECLKLFFFAQRVKVTQIIPDSAPSSFTTPHTRQSPVSSKLTENPWTDMDTVKSCVYDIIKSIK